MRKTQTTILMKQHIKLSNRDVVEETLRLLKNNPEWKERYAKYAKAIKDNGEKYGSNSRKFQLKKPLYIYSSITKAKNDSSTSTFDMRFAGQSIGEITVNKKGLVTLKVSDQQASYAKENFDYDRAVGFSAEWHTQIASEYRSKFSIQKSTKETKIHSQEHRIENWMLAEFAKKTRKEGKLLCNIQPVRLGGKFFQLATPLSASNHGEKPKYSSQNGGGIDILARVNHTINRRDNRFAVIELKDENKPEESQAMTIQQALTYATFLACLLRSDSGNDWWHILGRSKEVPDDLIIDAVTLMPKGNSEEGSLEEIKLDELNVTIHPHTLYYEKDKNGNPMYFYGTLRETLANKGV